MDPLTIANLAFKLLDVAVPAISELVKKGEISVEDQNAVKAKLDELRTQAAFAGPEWEVK